MTPSLSELEAERDFLLRSIDDLEAERAAGDVSDADFIDLCDAYVARTAIVLRTIDARQSVSVTTSTAATPAVKTQSGARYRTPLAVAGALGVAALMVWGLLGATDNRAPGEAITGEVIMTPTQEAATAGQQAQALFAAGRFQEALEAFDTALAANPDNVEAITYRAWLLYQVGAQSGEASINAVAAEQLALANSIDPTYPDAWAFRGVVLLRTFDDPVGAAVAMRTYLALIPPNGQIGIPLELVEGVLADALDQAAARNLSVPIVAGTPTLAGLPSGAGLPTPTELPSGAGPAQTTP